MLDTNPTHDLVIGLDRSDRKVDLHFINTTIQLALLAGDGV